MTAARGTHSVGCDETLCDESLRRGCAVDLQCCVDHERELFGSADASEFEDPGEGAGCSVPGYG
ncbi:hypothetical protein, partial [Vibrio cidicii]|uniref:hypothetical protein n=1 Tax=Vibrio cidicii TaxID=1763883 RepID=UPI003703FB72